MPWVSAKDSAQVVRRCDKCQRFSRIMKTAPEKFTPLTSLWPFAKWGVDIVGPMPLGKGSRKFLVVAVDYFTKWVEAEALAAITTTNITSFLWRSVVCRSGGGVQNFVSETTMPRYCVHKRMGKWRRQTRPW